MTFTLPPRPYPEEAARVSKLIEDDRGALWRIRVNRRRGRPAKLTYKERAEITRSNKPASELAERYGVSRQYVWSLRNQSGKAA